VTSTIDLSDDDPECVEYLMHYFYHLDYPTSVSKDPNVLIKLPNLHKSEAIQSSLPLHAAVYGIAEKYDVSGLKELAKTRFESAAKSEWNSADFSTAIELVYSTTPDSDEGLRSIVLDTLAQNPSLFARDDIEQVVKRINGLAYDLLKAQGGLMRFQCAGCTLKLDPDHSLYVKHCDHLFCDNCARARGNYCVMCFASL
jgi:hypothetical protein